jgi:hypothetical protein
MGQVESNPIRNLDKRTARREYREAFCAAIEEYRRQVAIGYHSDSVRQWQQGGSRKKAWNESEIRVCVRKRPINRDELKNSEFDVVTALSDNKTVIIHDARLYSDMKTQFINHNPFEFSRVFNESENNAVVYHETAAPLVDTAVSGLFGTCFMYGQTGSG